MKFNIQSERLTFQEYIAFLKESDLGSQYPKERFRDRIETLLQKSSISVVARDEKNKVLGVCLGITDFAYWLFVTDLGVIRSCTGKGIGKALIKKTHELAGGDNNIIMYICANENAVGFYKKLEMNKTNDVMVYDKMPWTSFTVE